MKSMTMRAGGVWAFVALLVFAAWAPTQAAAADRMLGVVEPVMAKEKYKLAYLTADINQAFFLGAAYGVVDEAERSGAEVVRVFSAGGYGKVAEQIGQMETARAMGVDAVILLSSAYNGFEKQIKRLTDSGIKVILLGAPINSKDASLIIAQNEGGLGALMAKHICDKKPGATVATLPGPPGVAWNKLRFEGFQEEAKSCGLNLVGNVYKGHITIEEAQAQTTDLLLKYPETDYIYAVAGVFGVGAAQVAKRMKHKAKVVTAVVYEKTVEMIEEGYISMAVAEPAVLFGRASTQYAIRVLNGDPLPNMVPGIFDYPAAFVRNLTIEQKDLAGYDLYTYDLPPVGWKPKQLQ